MFQHFWKKETGQGLIEYSLIVAIISLAAVVIIMTVMAGNISKNFNHTTDKLNEVGSTK